MSISFDALHQHAQSLDQRTRRDTTTPAVDPETGQAIKSIDDILAEANGFHFVDNPGVQYAQLLATEDTDLKRSPLTASGGPIDWKGQPAPRVAVIGGGVSGLYTAWQLAKAGLLVNLYEAGPAPVVGETINGAGRLKATILRDGNKASLVEYGAMRFPSTSYLYWSYQKKILGLTGSETFTAFPNPGRVPTLFRGNGKTSDVLAGVWHTQGVSVNIPEPYASLAQRHIESFIQYHPPGVADTAAVIRDLVKQPPSATTQDRIKAFWQAAIHDIGHLSYRDFLSVRGGYSNDDIEIIGYIGFGTGGFAPLFQVCALEMMRLTIWDYSAEFANPRQYEFAQQLATTAQSHGVHIYYNAPVAGIAYSMQAKQYVPLVDTAPGQPGVGNRADFLVLSMSHKAAQRLLHDSQAASARVPNFASLVPQALFPLYDTQHTAFESDIKRDLEAQIGINVIKIFQTMAGPARNTQDNGPLTAYASLDTQTPFDRRIRSAFGALSPSATSPIGVSYMLPLAGTAFSSQTYASALHYAWQDEAQSVYDKVLARDHTVHQSLSTTGYYHGRRTEANGVATAVLQAYAPRYEQARVSAEVAGNPLFGHTFNFISYLPGSSSDEGYFSIVHWNTVPYIWMGFKLDNVGCGAFLTQAFQTVSNAAPSTTLWDKASVKGSQAHESMKKLYFTGCSMSNYGGWVEGAMQSAINAMTAITKEAAVMRLGTTAPCNPAMLSQVLDHAPTATTYGNSPHIGFAVGTRTALEGTAPRSLYVCSGQAVDKLGFDAADAVGGNGGVEHPKVSLENLKSIVAVFGNFVAGEKPEPALSSLTFTYRDGSHQTYGLGGYFEKTESITINLDDYGPNASIHAMNVWTNGWLVNGVNFAIQ